MLEMTDGFASWFFADWMLVPNGCSVTGDEEGLSGADTVLIQAWVCLSGGTAFRAGTSGGRLDGGFLAACLFLAIGTG